jgi:hypothetical protein
MNEDRQPGIIYVPYIFKTTRTTINNVTVWYSNKFINMLIKIKHFFYTPKELKNFKRYSNKTIDSKFYQKIQINNE